MNNHSNLIYLDNNASTMVAPEVLSTMIPYYNKKYGNVSNTLNIRGFQLQKDLFQAADSISSFFNAYSGEDFLFTSGATESNNIVLRSIAENCNVTIPHIITTNIEHASILETCHRLQRKGTEVTYIHSSQNGIIDPDDLKKSIRKNTVLISVMGANNEIGTIQPISEIAKIAHEHNIPFHSDVSQLISSKKIDLKNVPIDFLTFSGHKIHAPIGVGCLYINRECRSLIKPMITGGNQQNGLRSGTINLPGIIALSCAVELLNKNFENYNSYILYLRNKLFQSLSQKCNIKLNGSLDYRISNNLSIIFSGVSSLAMANKLPDVLFSNSSACSTASQTTSHVLKAIGLNEDDIRCTIRLGLSRYNTESEIDVVSDKLAYTYLSLKK